MLFFKLEDEGPSCDVRGAVALDATDREHLGFVQMRGHEHLRFLRPRAWDRIRLRLALRRTRRRQKTPDAAHAARAPHCLEQHS